MHALRGRVTDSDYNSVTKIFVLKIWIIEVGEPLPLQGSAPRLMRAGQLAFRMSRLADVDVTWWVSDFNHTAKQHYLQGLQKDDNGIAVLSNGVKARLLHGRGYFKNVSIRRLIHNRDVAQDFTRQSILAPRPDVIFCCYPTIDLAEAVTSFGIAKSIPVVLDVRDLWPDAFIDVLALPKTLARTLIFPLTRKANRAFSQATVISAISEPILDWALSKAGRTKREMDRVLPLSYDLPKLDACDVEESESQWRARGLKLDGTEIIACAFGMLSKVPEFETIIEALDHVPNDLRSRLRVVICGSGERLPWLQQAALRYKQLLLPGFVDANAIVSLMRHATAGLLAYPSRGDLMRSYPNKIGEYLAGGLPVISTLGGASAQLLRERGCGIVVPNRDSQAFAQALCNLAVNSGLREQMSARARATFFELFDASRNYKHMTEFLLQIAQAQPAHDF